MTSILTNTAAMSSLQALTATQRQLSKTQTQISSGLAVAQASDNAAYWSIGQTMSAQVAGLGAVNRGLSLTLSIADVTSAALGSIKTSLDRIQADVVAAQQSGVSLSAVQADISAQQQSIIAVVGSASFNGVNWLTNRISTSQTVTIRIDADPDEVDYAKIALGQIPNGHSSFDSTITQTFTQSEGGVSTSETTPSGYHTTRDVAGDGTVTTVKEAITLEHIRAK